MTSFKPVHLDAPLPRTLRQTWLRHFNLCPRSAFLASKYADSMTTAAMARGTAVHEIFARSTAHALSTQEAVIPPDVVKTVVDEVLAEQSVPFEEHDGIREMAWRWATEFAMDPDSVVAVETLFQLQVGDWTVRARVDFAELLEDGKALLIRDYKTSRAAPPFDEVARKVGGRLVAKNFQLVLYALLVAFGVPVRETHRVGGEETPEPFGVAPHARDFHMEFVYPGLENAEGRMVTRPVELDMLELAEYRSSLEGLVTRVVNSESSGHWPAVVSDAACGECPAPGECPIPQEVRNWRGRINTMEQAGEAAMVLDRQKAELRAAQTELRNFAKANGSIRSGGRVWELVYSEHEEVADKEAFFAAVDRGERVDRSEFMRTKGRTDFRARDLTVEEQGDE